MGDGPTSDELDEVARRYNYRRTLGFDDARLVAVYVTVMGSCLNIGGGGAISAADAGERRRAVVLLVLGIVLAWFAWRFLRRPARPNRDDDFERELRHRNLI